METLNELVDQVTDRITRYETSIERLQKEKDDLVRAGQALYELISHDKKSSLARKRWEELVSK